MYLKRDGNRLIKLRKGEAGNGTCYNETSGCQTYYSLHNIGKGVIEVTIQLLLKSVQGFYELYTYCTGTDHNCNRYGAIKKFWLIIEVQIPTPTVVTHTAGSSVNESSGSAFEPTSQLEDSATTGMGSSSSLAVKVAVPIAIVIAALIACMVWYKYGRRHRCGICWKSHQYDDGLVKSSMLVLSEEEVPPVHEKAVT